MSGEPMSGEPMSGEPMSGLIDGRGDRIVVSVSGGKDSAATCLMLMELGYGPDDYDRVFADTGWELPSVYDYLRGPLTDKVGPIQEICWRDPAPLPDAEEHLAQRYEQRLGMDYSAMVRVVLKKASLPSRVSRFCTEQLKIKPFSRHLRAMDAEPVCAVGIRGAESLARSKMEPWEWNISHDCWVWRPLLSWSLADVVAIHQRHGLRPAPPYLAGADRVGCAPCIMCRKSEIAWLADQYPERMAILADLEADVDRLCDGRRKQRGQPEKGYRLGWFYSKRGPPKGAPTYRPFWLLSEVIDWARGPRNQEELFTPEAQDFGCMRWGFCDAGEDRE